MTERDSTGPGAPPDTGAGRDVGQGAGHGPDLVGAAVDPPHDERAASTATADGAFAVRSEPSLDLSDPEREREPRPWLASLGLGLVGAVIGGAIVLAALLGGALPGFSGAEDSGLAAHMAALEQDLASTRDTASSSATRVSALEGGLKQAQAGVSNAVALAEEAKADAGRAAQGGAQAAPAAADAAQDRALQERAVEDRALQDRLAKLEARPDNPAADQIKALSDDLSAVKAQAGQAQGTLAEVPGLKAELASVTSRLGDALVGRQAAGVVALDALDATMRSGKPFAAEMRTAAALGQAGALAPLQTMASTGVASLSGLQAGFESAAPAIRTALTPAPERPAADAGVLDRLGFSLSRVVAVRRADEADIDPTRPVGLIEAALARGDVTGALTAFDALPEAARQPAAAWASEARARHLAEGTLATARSQALEAIAKSGTQASSGSGQ